MKKLNLILAAAALGFAAASVSAGTAAGDFTVTANLTPKCLVKGTPTGVTFDYDALNGVTAKTDGAVVFTCTRGFGASPTVELDTATDATAGAAGQGTTGAGVVQGLQYTLVVAPGTRALGGAATTASIGSADEYSYAITGNMAAGQAGDASKSNTQTRRLTITY